MYTTVCHWSLAYTWWIQFELSYRLFKIVALTPRLVVKQGNKYTESLYMTVDLLSQTTPTFTWPNRNFFVLYVYDIRQLHGSITDMEGQRRGVSCYPQYVPLNVHSLQLLCNSHHRITHSLTMISVLFVVQWSHVLVRRPYISLRRVLCHGVG